MVDLASMHVIVRGFVQGVYFRDFACRHAQRLGLSGYVRNLPDGTVEVRAGGERTKLEELVERLKEGPPSARVSEVSIKWSTYTDAYNGFTVRF